MKKIRRSVCSWCLLVSAAAACLGLSEAVARADTITDYSITNDTYVDARSANQNINYSTSTVDKVVVNATTPSDPARTLLAIPAAVWSNAGVTSAKLVFTLYGISGAPDVWLYPLTQGFTLSGATWNKYNGSIGWATPGGDYEAANGIEGTYDSGQGTYTFDLFSNSSVWNDANLRANGAVLKMASEAMPATMQKATFYSSREPTFIAGRPYVEVTTVPEPGAWTMLLAGIAVIAGAGLHARRRSPVMSK